MVCVRMCLYVCVDRNSCLKVRGEGWGRGGVFVFMFVCVCVFLCVCM